MLRRLRSVNRRRKPHLDIVARGRRGNCGGDAVSMRSNQAPIGRRQGDDRQPAAGQVLLMPQILIRCDEAVDAVCLGRIEQITITQQLPATFKSGFDVMIAEELPQRNRRTLVEENAHRSSGFYETLTGVFEDRLDLIPRDPGEPLDEVRDGRTTLDVLEERRHGHSRVAEDPGTAHATLDALHRGTS